MSQPRPPNALHDTLEVAELLAERAWLRRFAAALAGAEGEDLVQDAWLRALSRPTAALARPRAWLASALRNAARSRARSEARRARRERSAARPEAEPSTDELAARAELEQLAVRAVLALDEPYREALLLRYLRGLEPAEIAERLGVPASTVRNRVARGLELVRARLDAGHGRREAWLALVLPLERWAWPLAGGSGAATTVAVTSGGLMGAKWIAGGALAAIAAALWWTAREPHDRRVLSQDPYGNPVVLVDAPPGAPDEPDVAAAVAQDAPAARESLVDAPAPIRADSTALVVRLTWARDGSPAAGEPLSLMAWNAEPFASPVVSATDAAGMVRFDGLTQGSYLVDTCRKNESVDVVSGETTTLELVLPLGVDVDCRVVDRDGVAVSGAEVWLSDYGSDSDGLVVGRTGAGGRLELRDVPYAHHSLAARAAGHAPSAQIGVRGSLGTRVEIELRLRGVGAELAGVVHDEAGAPVSGAELLVGVEFPPQVELADGTSASGPPPIRLTADTNGRFRASGLEPGTLLVQGRAAGFGPGRVELPIAAGESASLVLTLGAEFPVRGVVRDAAGEPLAGVSITGGPQYYDFGGRHTSTGADGSYVLRGLGRGAARLGAGSRTHGNAKTELQLEPETEARWDPVLAAGGEVGGLVRDERGESLEGWQVAATEPGNTGLWLREARTDATGRFRLVNCPPQRFVLAVRAPWETFGSPSAVVEDFVLGQDDLVIVIPDDAHPSAFLVGRVRAADGSELALPSLTYFPPAIGHGLGAPLDADGAFRIGPLRPGEYALAASARDLGEVRLRGLELAPDETEDVGELVLEPPGQVLVRVRATDGVLPENMRTEIVREREHAGEVRYDGLEGRSGPLGRGRYVLRTNAREWRAAERVVDVLPGETCEVELELEPATGRILEFRVPPSDPAARLDVLVRNERGETIEEYAGASRSADRFVLGLGGFAIGTYSVEARTDSGRFVAGSFVVLDLVPTTEPVVFELR